MTIFAESQILFWHVWRYCVILQIFSIVISLKVALYLHLKTHHMFTEKIKKLNVFSGGCVDRCAVQSRLLKIIYSAAILLCFCPSIFAEDKAEVRPAADLSVYPEISIGESASLRVTTVWETDLVNEDANEDAHFSFIKDGVVYLLVEPYQGKESFLLRRLSADDGSLIGDGDNAVKISFPEGTEGNDHAGNFRINRFITDETGYPLLVSFEGGERELKISVYQLDWNATLENKCLEFLAEPRRFSVEAVFGAEYESYNGGVFNVKGSAARGDLSFDFLHLNCDNNFKNSKHRLWHAVQSGDIFFTDHTDLNFNEVTADWAKSWMNVYHVSEDMILVGSSLNGLYEAYSDDSRLFSMSAEPFEAINFCFRPFTIGGYEFFCKTGSFDESEGVNFDIVRWDDRTSPANMETLFSAPGKEFAYPSKFYRNVMSQYLITDSEMSAQENGDSRETTAEQSSIEKDIYLYSPGSGIGKYHLELTAESTGLVGSGDVASETDLLTFASNRLTVKGGPRDVSVYSLSGGLVKHFANVSSVDLSDLVSGIYVAACGDRILKITIK